MIDAPKLSQIRTVWLEALFIFRPQGEDTLRGNPCVDAQIFPNPVSPVGGEVHFQDGIQWCFVTWWIEGFFNNFSLKALYRFYKNIQHLNRRQIISIEWATTPHNFNSCSLTHPHTHIPSNILIILFLGILLYFCSFLHILCSLNLPIGDLEVFCP